MGLPPQAGTHPATPLPQEGVPPCPARAITLQALHPQDALRDKWKLGDGLAPASEQAWQRHEASQAAGSSNSGYLRITATDLNDADMTWERCIPFSELAHEGGITIGRGEQSADISLPYASVSRRHALLEIAGNGLVITDLGSSNGTCVDEFELSPYSRRFPLANGADIFLGNANLHLEYIRIPRYFLH